MIGKAHNFDQRTKNSLKKKAELRLQQKIVDEHLNQIKKLKEENERFEEQENPLRENNSHIVGDRK